MKNLVAWNIIYSIDIKKEKIWLNNIITKVRDGIWNIFLYWEIELQTSEEVFNYIKSLVMGKILSYDISISTEDRIMILRDEQLEWKYELYEAEWARVTFDNTVERNMADGFTVAIREAEVSKKFGNRIIKIDKII